MGAAVPKVRVGDVLLDRSADGLVPSTTELGQLLRARKIEERKEGPARSPRDLVED